MSFDSEFDYTHVLESYNGKILELQEELDNSNATINLLGNLDAQYQHLTVQESQYYTNLKTKLNKDISNFGNVVGEIQNVITLPSHTKNVIYDFYTTYLNNGINGKIVWMRSMPFNIGNGLEDDVGNLMADGNITSEEANLVVELICGQYPPKRQTMGFTKILINQFIN